MSLVLRSFPDESMWCHEQKTSSEDVYICFTAGFVTVANEFNFLSARLSRRSSSWSIWVIFCDELEMQVSRFLFWHDM
jgi:hypothetical protein